MIDVNRVANWSSVRGRTILAFLALGILPALTSGQSVNAGGPGRQNQFFITISGGSFYTIAADSWYADAGIGIGREIGRGIALEIDLAHSPLETPSNHIPYAPSGVNFKTPVTTLAVAARVTVPFAPALFFGAGGGVLHFDGSDGVASFATPTAMGILGLQKAITRRTFARVEGHYRVDRHPPFNGINGEIIGVIGLRF
jgi:hypothetical protein